MKIKNIITWTFFCGFGIYAQPVVEHSPLFPSLDKPIVITFYADRGSKGLSGHNGDVYAHTGVSLIKAPDLPIGNTLKLVGVKIQIAPNLLE